MKLSSFCSSGFNFLGVVNFLTLSVKFLFFGVDGVDMVVFLNEMLNVVRSVLFFDLLCVKELINVKFFFCWSFWCKLFRNRCFISRRRRLINVVLYCKCFRKKGMISYVAKLCWWIDKMWSLAVFILLVYCFEAQIFGCSSSLSPHCLKVIITLAVLVISQCNTVVLFYSYNQLTFINWWSITVDI